MELLDLSSSILSCFREPVFVINKSGEIVYKNVDIPLRKEDLRIRLAEQLEVNFPEFIIEKQEKLKTSGFVRKVEILIDRFKDDYFELNIHHNGDQNLFFCLFKDITEKVELESQIRINKELLDDHIEELTSANEVLRNQNRLIHQTQENIQSSMRYGKLIQDRINASAHTFSSLFPNSFIMYKPQHEIGGDLVWCSQSKIGKIVAVVDCMGHGVPGAMLSMSVFHFLNAVLMQGRFQSATQFLSNVIAGYSSTFFDNNLEDSFGDTFDISVCVIDENSQLLRYRGIKQQLLIMKEEGIIEYKGDRISVSDENAIARLNEEPWDKVYPYKKGDQIYMFSDGFPDQFGGAQDKKYKYHNFKKFLKRISIHQPAQQKIKLDSELWDWQNTFNGTYDQTDDITVVGIEL